MTRDRLIDRALLVWGVALMAWGYLFIMWGLGHA